ncbi:MAG: hypothetical protein WD607_08925 [Candidatus Paceibacterota bacterium]
MEKQYLIIRKCQKCGIVPDKQELSFIQSKGKTIYPDRPGFGGKALHKHKNCGGKVEVEAKPKK